MNLKQIEMMCIYAILIESYVTYLILTGRPNIYRIPNQNAKLLNGWKMKTERRLRQIGNEPGNLE